MVLEVNPGLSRGQHRLPFWATRPMRSTQQNGFHGLLGAVAADSRLLAATALFAVLAVSLVPMAIAQGRDTLSFPQKRGATHAEMLKHQVLGRTLVAPSGNFFVYEWARPLDWKPDYTGVGESLATRKQTFLYLVRTPDHWVHLRVPTSEQLFVPSPGATYYLGNLSPDGRQVSFYEFDWDDGNVRAGVVAVTGNLPRKVTWLDMIPDHARLEQQPATWISNEELVYPIRLGSLHTLARANAITGEAQQCAHCDKLASPAERRSSRNPRADSSRVELGPMIAQSTDGRLKVYSRNTRSILTLSFSKNDRAVTLFENARSLDESVSRTFERQESSR